MNKKNEYLIKNLILFVINGFIPKLIALIMIPIYTAYMTKAEYGVAELVQTTAQLCIPFFTLQIQDAVMRFAFDDRYEKRDVFTTGIAVILVGGIVVSLVSILARGLNILRVDNYYILFFVLLCFLNAISSTVVAFMSATDRVKIVVWASFADSVATLLALVLFLVKLHMGTTGFFASATIGLSVKILVCFFGAHLYRYITFKPHSATRKSMILYSLPLILEAVSWWINYSSDRYAVTWLLGIEAGGLYSIAYKIPSLLTMLKGMFCSAWSISAIREFDKDDSDGFVSNVLRILFTFISVVCSFLIIFSIPVAKILFSKGFFDAWLYVPPLLVSIVFNGAASYYGKLFVAVKDTKTIAFSTAAGAIVNMICNIIFIKITGDAYSATIATLLGDIVFEEIRRHRVKKYIKLKTEPLKKAFVYALLATQIVLAYFGLKYIVWQVCIFAMILFCLRDTVMMIVEGVLNKWLYRSTAFRNEYEYVAQLMKCTLNDEQPAELPKGLSFDKVFEISKEHMVEGITYLSVLKLENKPDEALLEKWEEAYMTAILADGMHDEFRTMLLRVFAKFSIKSTEVQGTVLKNIYPSPDLRQMSDLDFIVLENDLPKIKEILEKVGFKTQYSMGRNNNVAELWADRPDGIVLEFHIDYFHELGNYFDLHNPFEGAVPSEDGCSYKAAPENVYLFTMLHFIKHWEGGCGLRRLADLYMIKHRMYDKINRQYVDEFMEKYAYKNQMDEFFALAEKMFGASDELPTGKLRRIQKNVFASGAHGNPPASFEQMCEREKHLIVARIKYIFVLLFPPKQRLYTRYIFLRKNEIALPFCWLYKAYDAIFKRRKTLSVICKDFKKDNLI